MDDLNTGGPSDYLYPPEGVGHDFLPPINMQTSIHSMQHNLVLQNQAIHQMKAAFDAQMQNMQAEYMNQLNGVRQEQLQVQQENQLLRNVPPMSSGSLSTSKLDCPSFGSGDEQTDMKLGLHDYHMWRVQAMAWYAESGQSGSAKHVQLFTRLRGRAARVATAKISLDQLRSDQGLHLLLGVLEWAYGGDSADNVLQAVTELLECRRGASDMLTWMNRLDILVYRLANFGIGVDDRFTGALALLNSGLNKDQRAMVVATTGRTLNVSNVLVAMRQLFPGSAQQDRVDVLYGAGEDTRTKTSTEKAGARVTCWKCGQKGHVQRECPMKSQKSSTPVSVFVAQGSSNPEQHGEEHGDQPVATDVPNHTALTVVGHDVGLGDSLYPGVCFMVLPVTQNRGGAPQALRGLCEASYGSGTIDLGCTDTLCGDGWLKHYLALLGPDSAGLHRRETRAWFVFGDGYRFTECAVFCGPASQAGWWRAFLTHPRHVW